MLLGLLGNQVASVLIIYPNKQNPMKPYVKLSRSKKRYQEYLRSEELGGFAEWLGIKKEQYDKKY